MNDIDQLLSALDTVDNAISNAEDHASRAESAAQEAQSALEDANNELSTLRSLIEGADTGNSRAERLIEAIRAALATYDHN